MIGIGVTTRNRPAVLQIALRHFERWLPPSTKLIVFDDASTTPNANANLELCHEFMRYRMDPWLTYHYSGSQLGIAKAKNACLWELRSCDHVFLFDDDAMPAGPDWWQVWLAPGLGHLTFSMEISHLEKTADHGPGWQGFTGCLGCVLYFSRRALAVLGAYDPRFGVYGYEHCQMSIRAHKAKITPCPYPAPIGVTESIYSLDMHGGWLHQKPPLDPEYDLSLFTTSVTREEAESHVRYSDLIVDPPVNCKLEAWQK